MSGLFGGLVPGDGNFEVATFPDLPDPTSVVVGRRYTALGAICTNGATGTGWQSSGTLWRPAGRQDILVSTTQIDGAAAPGVTTEQILLSTQFSGAPLRGVRRFGVVCKLAGSANDASARTVRLRLGTTGTTSDTPIASYSWPANNNTQSAGIQFIVTGQDTLRIWARDVASAGSWTAPETQVANGNPPLPDTTLSSPLSTPGLFLSISLQQGASPNSRVSLNAAAIYVE